MSETEALFSVLRQSSDAACVSAIEQAVREASDRDLCRVNPLAFAAKRGLDEERTIAAFLHASRLGIFELSWNVLCPGCGGVLEAGTTLKTINRDEYDCGLCAAGYKPTLDEMVEVTFTVSSRVRRIAAHTPDTLSEVEYYRQIFWSSGVDLPETLGESLAEFTVDSIELAPGEKAVLSVQLPKEFIIVFDPVTHGTQFVDVKGEPTHERQTLSIVFNKVKAPAGAIELRPGPLRVTLENRTDRRVLPALWIAGDKLHHLLGRRRAFLTAKRLLTNQTFRDIYRTDTLDVDQRLKITSLTFLFTDLKGSTALYERVGGYPQRRQHATIGAVFQRHPQRPGPHLDGSDRRLDLVEHHGERLPLMRRLALDVNELGAVRHRIEDNDELLRQLHRQHGLFARRKLDRIDRELGQAVAQRLRQIDAGAPENLPVIFDFRQRVGTVRGDAANARAHRERDLDHLVERRLIAGGAQPAIVLVAIDGLKRRAGLEHAAATGTEDVPGQLENPEPRGVQERRDGTLLVEAVLGSKGNRIHSAKVAIGGFIHRLLDG